jgi:hypothetical protein
MVSERPPGRWGDNLGGGGGGGIRAAETEVAVSVCLSARARAAIGRPSRVAEQAAGAPMHARSLPVAADRNSQASRQIGATQAATAAVG